MAAAAANSEILEDISKVLQMLEEEITKIHKLCLLRRREIDCCIQQCRPLLKPWPLKSDKSEETTENTAKSSMIHQSESTVVQGTEITENEAKEAERQDLAALDGLLAKAQKAREIQTKIDEAAAKANQKKVSSKKPIPVTTAHAKESPLHATKESLSSRPSKPAASKKPSAAGKSAAQRQVLKSTYSSSYGRRPPSAKSLIRPAKSQSSANDYLDSVIGRNAKEGKQTINDSKQQGSIASSSKRNLTSAGGVNVDSKRHDTVVSLPEVKDGSSSATRLLNAQACNAQSIEIRHCHGLDVPDDNVHSSSLTERDHQPGSVTGKSPESVSALRKGDCLPNSDQADKQEMFDPFGEGVELKLPIKYRRLKATTVKLYSELENFSEKRESPMPSQQFVQGIESLFDMGDIPTHSELQAKGIALLKEHEKLSILTSNVVNRSENLGDDSPWPEVYKCYRLWQIVLNKFNELQKGTQQLLEAEERLSKVCPCGKCSFCDREYLWDDSSCQVGGKGQEGCVLLASWLSEEIQDISSRQNISRRRGTTEFTYSSPRELSELIRLHHETQVLCMQFHIKKLAGEKLLPILEKLEPSDSAFVPLYRMIHGFLCGDCKVFPAVVLDNV